METVIIEFDGTTYRVPGAAAEQDRYTEACEEAMAIARSIHGVQAYLEVHRVLPVRLMTGGLCFTWPMNGKFFRGVC